MFPSSQPSLNPLGRSEQLFRFKVLNPGDREISVGRVSMQLTLSGVEFGGGLDVGKVQLKELVNGREINGVRFNTTSAGGDTVVFDAVGEVFLGKRSEREFVLKAVLDDLPGDPDGDFVTVKILGDTVAQAGTFEQVRGGGANFIWSDHSGRPHTTSSSDWRNGRSVFGLPSNPISVWRR